MTIIPRTERSRQIIKRKCDRANKAKPQDLSMALIDASRRESRTVMTPGPSKRSDLDVLHYM